MTETLQDKIDSISHVEKSLNQEHYFSSVKPYIDKAIEELLEEVNKLPRVFNDGKIQPYISINDVLALIGEKHD